MDAEVNGAGMDGQCDVAYVLFLEPSAAADQRRSPGEQCLDVAIRNFQPAPALAHCELLLPPLPAGEAERTQFATYLGKQSGWQVDRQDGFGFYLVEHGSRWRALPVFSPNAASRLRAEADMELGVEYSLARYLTSARPLRFFSGLVSDSRRAPAHCANLAARVLKNGLEGSFSLPHSSNYYGPSSLYIELCAQARSSARRLGAQETAALAPSAAHGIEQLLRAPMTAATVQALGDEGCMEAVRALTVRALGALVGGDGAAGRLTQQQLATALLRWVLLRDQPGSPVFG